MWSQKGIQVRADSVKEDRPSCRYGCSAKMHGHGWYWRFLARGKGHATFRVHRYLCPQCGHTISVLPVFHLTYRPLEVERLQGYFDVQAKVSCGLDPPPELFEAGCLQRAWKRFLTRVDRLKDAFGQMLPAELEGAEQLWKELRRTVGSAEAILRFLARNCNCSLLGDYFCLRPPD
jgi:hypothetical protein